MAVRCHEWEALRTKVFFLPVSGNVDENSTGIQNALRCNLIE